MTTHTGSVFAEGPVRRILSLAVAVQDSAGELSLDDELRRFIRLSKGPGGWVVDWMCPVVTVTALLDHVAGLCGGEGVVEGAPPRFQELLRRASEGMVPADYLRTLAGTLRILEADPPPDFEELPMSRWELDLRFPLLSSFGVYWVYEGEYATLDESIRAAIDSEHPFCAEFLAPLAAQAQTALVLFPGERAMAAGPGSVISWITPDSLHRLLAAIHTHMRQEHVAP